MSTNPIETLEDLIFSQDWPSKRLSENEIMAEVTGRWCDYNIHFVWDYEEDILQFYIVLLDIVVPDDKMPKVYELLAHLNEKLPIGHFEVFTSTKTAVLRQGFILPGTRTMSEALIERVLETSLETCERYYPTFQFVIFGDKDPADAANMSIVDTAGEA